MTIRSITKLPEEKDFTNKYEELVEIFNNESKNQGLKYRLVLNGGCCLEKPIFWNIGNSLGKHEVIYDNEEKCFKFDGGLDDSTFQDIHSLLHSLKGVEFKIELI